MSGPREEKCGTCYYCVARKALPPEVNLAVTVTGFCRKNSPAPVIVSLTLAPGYLAVWPAVDPGYDWCGQWRHGDGVVPSGLQEESTS